MWIRLHGVKYKNKDILCFAPTCFIFHSMRCAKDKFVPLLSPLAATFPCVFQHPICLALHPFSSRLQQLQVAFCVLRSVNFRQQSRSKRSSKKKRNEKEEDQRRNRADTIREKAATKAKNPETGSKEW